LSVAVLFAAFSGAAAQDAPNRDEDWRAIEARWPQLMAYMKAYIKANARRSNIDLYHVELWTYDLMRAAIEEKRFDIRDDLLGLYTSQFESLVEVSTYKYLYDPRAWPFGRTTVRPLPAKTRLWLNDNGLEEVLASSQFLYLISSTARLLSQAGQTDGPAGAFVSQAIPIVQSHALRWVRDDAVFEVTGWGCGAGLYNHRDFLRKKRERAFSSPKSLSYCNMTQDFDLWVIALVAELVAAQSFLDPSLRMEKRNLDDLKAYLREAGDLMRERISSRTFKRPDGSIVEGLVYEAGAFRDHEVDRFANYEGSSCPRDDAPAVGVGWDVSHGTRQPVVFSALYELRPLTGMTWPDKEALAGFGRAFAYGVFEGDLSRPRLRNFLDGSNGWYQGDAKTCTGFPPFSLSEALPYGAWGRYTPFAPEVGPIVMSARRLLSSAVPDDVTFRKNVWDKARFVDGQLHQNEYVNGELSVWMLPLLSTYAIGSPVARGDLQ
jgi:hypothetical protein